MRNLQYVVMTSSCMSLYVIVFWRLRVFRVTLQTLCVLTCLWKLATVHHPSYRGVSFKPVRFFSIIDVKMFRVSGGSYKL